MGQQVDVCPATRPRGVRREGTGAVGRLETAQVPSHLLRLLLFRLVLRLLLIARTACWIVVWVSRPLQARCTFLLLSQLPPLAFDCQQRN